MRCGSFFSALRGKDGRSLARALIVLVLVSLFVGGLNTGAAAAGSGTAFCSTDSSGDSPDAPRHHEPDCCLPGSTPFGLALAAAPPAAAPPTDILHGGLSCIAGGSPSGGTYLRASARGPPLDA